MGNAERREPTIAQILNESNSKRHKAELQSSAFLLYTIVMPWRRSGYRKKKQEINIHVRCLSPVSPDGGCGLFSVVFVRNGQLLASFSTTSSQHAAAVFSCHSLAEAVLVYATAVVRLKCSFHFALFIFYCYYLFERDATLRRVYVTGCKGTYFFLSRQTNHVF